MENRMCIEDGDMLQIRVKKKKKSQDNKNNDNGTCNEEKAARPESELKKKNHKNKEKHEGSCVEAFKKVEDDGSPNGKEHIGGSKSVKSLGITEAEQEFNDGKMVEAVKKKKKKPKDKSENVPMISSSEHALKGDPLGKNMQNKELGGNEMEEVFNDAINVERDIKKNTKNKKKKKGTVIECFQSERPGTKDDENCAEEVEAEEAPDRKQLFRGKISNDDEVEVDSEDAPDRKQLFRGKISNDDEVEVDSEAKLGSRKDKKKQRNKDKSHQENVGRALSSDKILQGEEYIMTKEVGSNEIEGSFNNAVGMEENMLKDKKKSKIKKKWKEGSMDTAVGVEGNVQFTRQKDNVEGGSGIKLGYSKKEKKGKKSKKGIEDSKKATDTEITVIGDKEVTSCEEHSSLITKKRCRDEKEEHQSDKKKKKTAKLVKHLGEDRVDVGDARKDNTEEIVDHLNPSETKSSSRRVKFSDEVEVFPVPDIMDAEDENQNGQLVRGKRFSKEEDQMLKLAVLKYIEEHYLGEDGLKMVLCGKGNRQVRNCWKEINEALPWRPQKAVYCRAHSLFERAEKREWSSEDKELLKEWHEKHGANWRTLADELGAYRVHLKDLWRRIKLPNSKKGQWSQEEYQILFDLVNKDLQIKVSEEKQSKHGMLRDNIPWEAISTKLSTRNNVQCCLKWYNQMQSSLVKEGKWSDADDYRLMNALLAIDVSCEEDVEWDNILDHRPGDICRKRWKQMVNHLGQYGLKSFPDQVEVLSRRYCPDLLEAREAFDSKVPVS